MKNLLKLKLRKYLPVVQLRQEMGTQDDNGNLDNFILGMTGQVARSKSD